jgi:hypothetical protein
VSCLAIPKAAEEVLRDVPVVATGESGPKDEAGIPRVLAGMGMLRKRVRSFACGAVRAGWVVTYKVGGSEAETEGLRLALDADMAGWRCSIAFSTR